MKPSRLDEIRNDLQLLHAETAMELRKETVTVVTEDLATASSNKTKK